MKNVKAKRKFSLGRMSDDPKISIFFTILINSFVVKLPNFPSRRIFCGFLIFFVCTKFFLVIKVKLGDYKTFA